MMLWVLKLEFLANIDQLYATKATDTIIQSAKKVPNEGEVFFAKDCSCSKGVRTLTKVGPSLKDSLQTQMRYMLQKLLIQSVNKVLNEGNVIFAKDCFGSKRV